jgi:predicted PurR-regulated permease PerM
LGEDRPPNRDFNKTDTAELRIHAFFFVRRAKTEPGWLIVGILLLACWCAGADALAFVAAGIFGYALNPGVDWIASRRIGRCASRVSWP